MFRAFKTIILAAAIGVTGLMVPGMASAQSLQFDLNGKEGPRVHLVDPDRERTRDDERCSPDRALDKADRLGIRRARVVSVGRRTIEIRGNYDGDRVTVAFGRAPNCPVIRGL